MVAYKNKHLFLPHLSAQLYRVSFLQLFLCVYVSYSRSQTETKPPTTASISCFVETYITTAQMQWLKPIAWLSLISVDREVHCFFRENCNGERSLKLLQGASLVAQWLRVCLPMQGARVQALVWENPTCRGATGPVSHDY